MCRKLGWSFPTFLPETASACSFPDWKCDVVQWLSWGGPASSSVASGFPVPEGMCSCSQIHFFPLLWELKCFGGRRLFLESFEKSTDNLSRKMGVCVCACTPPTPPHTSLYSPFFCLCPSHICSFIQTRALNFVYNFEVLVDFPEPLRGPMLSPEPQVEASHWEPDTEKNPYPESFTCDVGGNSVVICLLGDRC